MGLKLVHTVSDGYNVSPDQVVVETTKEKLNTVLSEQGILHYVIRRAV